MRPTIVLVHGAFAEYVELEPRHRPLLARGPPVIAAANPLRGVAADAESVSDLVRAIEARSCSSAHSYGGAVITNVAADAGEIAGLVYVGGFAPEPGENCFGLAAMFPGSTLGDGCGRCRAATERPTSTSPRTASTTVLRRRPAPQAALMAATQRPVTRRRSRAVGRPPAVEGGPVVVRLREQDQNIPAALQHFMAERAGRAGRSRSRAPRTRSPSRTRRHGRPDPRGGGAGRLSDGRSQPSHGSRRCARH